MQTIGPHLRSTESETPVVGPAICVLTSSAGDSVAFTLESPGLPHNCTNGCPEPEEGAPRQTFTLSHGSWDGNLAGTVEENTGLGVGSQSLVPLVLQLLAE